MSCFLHCQKQVSVTRNKEKKLGECERLYVNLWFWFHQRLNLHLCFFFISNLNEITILRFREEIFGSNPQSKLKINFFVLVQFNVNLNPRVSFRVYQNVVWSKFISGLRRWTVWVMDIHHSLFFAWIVRNQQKQLQELFNKNNGLIARKSFALC